MDLSEAKTIEELTQLWCKAIKEPNANITLLNQELSTCRHRLFDLNMDSSVIVEDLEYIDISTDISIGKEVIAKLTDTTLKIQYPFCIFATQEHDLAKRPNTFVLKQTNTGFKFDIESEK